ncbi:MAG: hypothetical protein ACRDRT_08880, partial [Pseudonocardiaceae bacterium]
MAFGRDGSWVVLLLRFAIGHDLKVRVVLSRKGFDTVAGKGASPVLPDGRMVSMPIPEPRPTPGRSPTYENTVVPGENIISFAQLGNRCGLRRAIGPAHLDP